MELTPVESSNIEAIGFDGKTIAVRFRGGRMYEYTGAEDMAGLFNDFARSESKGKFFASQIKRQLTTRRVDDQST